MQIKVEPNIKPSEDPTKVERAIKNIFPEIDLKNDGDFLKGESDKLEALESLKNKLGLQAIRDSARRKLKSGKRNDKILFQLNKQAATVSKINFYEAETPLGPIKVSIESEKTEDIIDYLAPKKENRKE